MNLTRSLLFACAAALCLPAPTSRAQATGPQAWHFTSIAETTADGFDYFFPWSLSMNNNGTIAFYGVRPDDKKIVLKGNGERPLKTVFPDDAGIESGLQTAINDYESVAFSTASGTPQIKGLLIANEEGHFTHIYGAPNAQVGYVDFNNVGSVAFQRDVERGKEYSVMFAGRGGLRPVEGVARVNNISLNDNDNMVLALRTGVPNRHTGMGEFSLLLLTAGGTHIIANSDTSEYFSFFNPVINNDETIAFGVMLDDGGMAIIKSTGNFMRIADSKGPFRVFSSISLNNRNAVAFNAELDSGPTGIYTGADPVADKVIQTGDPLFGSTVRQVFYGTKGLNDRGEVAFWAKLVDGREVIARGTPAGGR